MLLTEFTVDEFVFEPTVVVAGRRTATLTLTNPGSDPVTVTAVRVDPADPTFTVFAETCSSAVLAPGASCVVDVQFAPQTLGELSALVIADLADGDAASVLVSGEGISAPTLDVVPDVALAGQVVTVFGAGFPADSTVDFSWGLATASSVGDGMTDAVPIDPDGTFAHVLVVLPNTPQGPVPIRVEGQPDTFGDAQTELLVAGNHRGSDPALRDGPGSLHRR